MSEKQTPHYADPKGIITTDFRGNGLLCAGTTVPTNGTSGYSPAALYFKVDGAAGAQVYVNEGTLASCLFRALSTPVTAGARVARGQTTTVTAADTIVTGLTTVISAVANLETTPVIGADRATAFVGNQAGAPAAGSIQIKTWKPTASGDATPVAATTFGMVVNWIAIGS